MNELMKKASKEAYGNYVKGKMLFIGNTFLTKREVSIHEAIKRVLSLLIRHSNVNVLYVSVVVKMNRTRMLKSISILEMMHPDHANVFASNIIDKYKNQPDNLYSMCFADLHPVISAKRQRSCQYSLMKSKATLFQCQVSDDVKLNLNITVLKNELGEMQKVSQPYIIRFH